MYVHALQYNICVQEPCRSAESNQDQKEKEKKKAEVGSASSFPGPVFLWSEWAKSICICQMCTASDLFRLNKWTSLSLAKFMPTRTGWQFRLFGVKFSSMQNTCSFTYFLTQSIWIGAKRCAGHISSLSSGTDSLHCTFVLWLRHFEVNGIFKLGIWLPSGYWCHLVTVGLWYMKILIQCSAAVRKANRLLEITGKGTGNEQSIFSLCITHEYASF